MSAAGPAVVGTASGAALEVGDVVPRRDVKLSMLRVEVKLYRRSRTSADTVKKPPHFQYLMRCDWSGADHAQVGAGGAGSDQTLQEWAGDSDDEGIGACWWTRLPRTYTIRRQWGEIAKFHEVLVNELAYDTFNACRRTKTQAPQLPQRGDLEAFVAGVAATGDVLVMNGRKQKEATTKEDQMKLRSVEDLDDMHHVYVHNRLMPYFEEVTKVLAELPTNILLNCEALRRLVTGRATVPVPAEERHRKRRFGPAPVLLDTEEAAAAARLLRKQRPGSPTLVRRSSASSIPGRIPSKLKGKEGTAAKAKKPVSPSAAFSMPLSPSSPSAISPRSPLGKSASAPSFADDDVTAASGWGTKSLFFDNRLGGDRDPDERERRLASSHYGFFARSVPSSAFNEFGHASQRGFWKKMAAKEGRELGRRTMLKFKNDEAPHATFSSRLPLLPPQQSHDSRRPPSEGSRSTTSIANRSQQRTTSPSILELSRRTDRGPNQEKRAEIREDVKEGLRGLILGTWQGTPSGDESPQVETMAGMASIEEALKIYKKYQELSSIDGDGDADDHDSSCTSENDDEEEDMPKQQVSRPSRPTMGSQTADRKELIPVSWPTFLGWVQREYDFAHHFRKKARCSSLMIALKRWRQYEASPSQRFHGVSLNLMFQWMFPSLVYQDIAQMLNWIALCEFEQIRQPTPRVIEKQDQRQLESIFHTMDSQGRGYCTADDIAGGPNQDMVAQLRNIVDAETVKKVCGDGRIYKDDFLQLMCEENYRAFDEAKKAQMANGQKLILVHNDVVGFTGWVYERPPKEEERQRKLITAIEAEVLRWRKMGASRKTRLEDVQSRGNMFT